jgi:hypothetical protein
MKIISCHECAEWVKARHSNSFALDDLKREYPHVITYGLSLNAGKKTVLSHFLSQSIDTTGPGLFWITAWGIFDSLENMAMFDGYRRSVGETRGIDEAPGHIFEESDVQELECLLAMSLYLLGRNIVRWCRESCDLNEP